MSAENQATRHDAAVHRGRPGPDSPGCKSSNHHLRVHDSLSKGARSRIPCAVFTSSLLQLPFIERTLGPRGRIGILTADAANLTPDHLRNAGGDPGRLTIYGLENEPFFKEAIFSGSGRLEARKVEDEVVARARQMVRADPAIRAILLECSNLPPYAAAVQEAIGMPVYDFVTMIHHVQSALARKRFR